MRSGAFCLLLAVLPAVMHPAFAAGEGELVALINARRAEARGCDGASERAVGPLAPSSLLARADPAAAAGDFGQALIAVGYRAAHATSIVVGGVAEAREAARLASERHCDDLRNRRYAEVGVARSGNTWRVNLAAPLLADNLGDWREAGRAVLRLVNDARRRGGLCGSQRFGSTGPLAWNERLAAASLAHSEDMAAHDYFDHVDRSGARVMQRASRHGYAWRYVGENIAAGQGSPEQVVAAWLTSPGHCANMLGSQFTEMGVAYAVNPRSAMDIYWTQVLGSR
jgi:uncharacterized protein YkwD